MREAAFILFVMILLLGLTALRYRKQIAALLSFGKMLSDAREQGKAMRSPDPGVTKDELVACSRCGTWSPKSTAIRFSSTTYYCSNECVKAAVNG